VAVFVRRASDESTPTGALPNSAARGSSRPRSLDDDSRRSSEEAPGGAARVR